ncbi:MAG: hypothetical protein BWX88_05330 [Planctomycetes bacterium ADurb.Bin126]|nr:MAG: hypothetical protein BWX88_05330 [Planctomycetes bacterium ADurb.Bin126]
MNAGRVNYAHYYALLAVIWAAATVFAVLAWMNYRSAGTV